MDTSSSFFIYALIAIFVIVNPANGLLTFVSMTRGTSEKTKNIYAKKSILLAAVVSIFFAITGEFVLKLMNINLDSLKVAGGILLFYIGFNMTTAKVHTNVTKEEIDDAQNRDFWIFPIAIPLLCGPGTISTVIILMGSTDVFIQKVLIIPAIILVYLITYIGFYFSRKINDILGYTGNLVITRLFGLFLASIAVGMITNGLYGIYHSFFTDAL